MGKEVVENVRFSRVAVPSALAAFGLVADSDMPLSVHTVPARCGVRDTRNDMAAICSAAILAERLRHTTCINGAPVCRTRLHGMFGEVFCRITVVAVRKLLVRGFSPSPGFTSG